MAALRALWTAKLDEAAAALLEIGFVEDVPAVVADDLAHADQYSPPAGRLLLAYDGDKALGTGALRRVGPDTVEVKRMYLHPQARGQGIGRALLAELLATARRMGCREARLDTGWFMADAHRMYRAAGFVACEPYPGSEVPPEFDARWRFMKLDLTAAAEPSD